MDGKMEEITSAGFKHFRKLYGKYGPKPITSKNMPDFEISSEFFVDVNAKSSKPSGSDS